MPPTHSVTFSIDGPHFAGPEHFSVPFSDEITAAVYAEQVEIEWPDARNIVVNYLTS
jgi:hypothetical protein